MFGKNGKISKMSYGFILLLILMFFMYNFSASKNSFSSLFGFILFPSSFSLNSIFDLVWVLTVFFLISIMLLVILKDTRVYSIKTLKIKDIYATVSRGKNKIVLVCNELINIPRITLRGEQRLLMEKNPSERSYERIYDPSYLIALSNNLLENSQVVFEISYKHGVIKLRFYTICMGKNGIKNQTIIEGSKICSTLQSTYGEVEFRSLSGEELRNTIWGLVGGEIRKIKKEKNVLTITSENGVKHVAFLEISGLPEIKAWSKRTQIDTLIQYLVKMKNQITIIFTFKPNKGLKRILEKKIDEHRIKNTYKKLMKKSEKKFSLRAKYDAAKVEEEYREKIELAEKTGEWKVQAYVIILGDMKEDVLFEMEKLKTILFNVYSGQKFAVKIRIFKVKDIKRNLGRALFRLPFRGVKSTSMSSFRLAAYVHLPENPFPTSAASIEPVTFEIPPRSTVTGPLVLGKVMYLDREVFETGIQPRDLTMHMTVIGQTGFGKTRFIQKILFELAELKPEVGWVIFDWKGEYAGLIKKIDQPILVLRPLTKYASLFINLFDPMGAKPEEHSQKLFSIIREIYSSLFETHEAQLSLQMERVLREGLTRVVVNPSKRSFKDLYIELNSLGKKWQKNMPTIVTTIEALKNRLDRLTQPPLGEIFITPPNINFDDLLNRKVIIDLNKVRLKGTREDARLLMNILVKYFFDAALRRGLQEDLKHLIVVEEAQFLVPQVLIKKTTIEGTPIEDMIMLERATGQGIIFSAVRPIISEHILANALTKVIFRTQTDSHIIAKYVNLNEEQESYLRVLPKREAIILHPNFPHPYRLKTMEFNVPKVSAQEIEESNREYFPHRYTRSIDYVIGKNMEQKVANFLNELCVPDDEPFILSTINEQHIAILDKIKNKYEFLGRVLSLVKEAERRDSREVILVVEDKNLELAKKYLAEYHLPVKIFSVNQLAELKNYIQSPSQIQIPSYFRSFKNYSGRLNLSENVRTSKLFEILKKVKMSPLKMIVLQKIAEREIATISELARELKLIEKVVVDVCELLTREDTWKYPLVERVGPKTYKITKYGQELVEMLNSNKYNKVEKRNRY